MKRILLALLLGGAAAAVAQTPEECVVQRGQAVAATATHGGKAYRFASAACRDVFLSDPERYAQLYDALEELAAAGRTPAPAPREASLVPS